MNINEDERLELEFLRFFYSEVEGALGPASDDIYSMIKQDYVDGGSELPLDYQDALGDEGDEDEDG